MSARHRPSPLRSTTARLAVAVAAGLATVMASAPMAVADDAEPGTSETPPVESAASDQADETPAPVEETPTPVEETPPAPETPDESTPPVEGETPPEVVEEAPLVTDETLVEDDTKAAAAEEVVPNYGSDKVRVGVQLEDGSYAPNGGGLGSTITITTKPSTGPSTSTTCVTAYEDGPGFTGCNAPFYTEPGATTTFTLTGPANGIVPVTRSVTLTPCSYDDFPGIRRCGFGSSVTLTATGPRPSATNDSVRTSKGEPITIDVLANDDSIDPTTSLALGSEPGDGTAVVIGQPGGDVQAAAVAGDGTQAIVYTPRTGFVGVDTFTYTITSRNGTATGSVRVRVVGAGAGNDGDDDSGDEFTPSEDRLLPDTGGADPRLLGYAALLLGSGGALTAHGRRRRHALVD